MVNVGILGATGMVGQRFVCLLENHPFFKVCKLGASANSAGKTYGDLMEGAGKWRIKEQIPAYVKDMVVGDLNNVAEMAEGLDLVFCAVDMEKDEIIRIEEAYAKAEVIVVSNNSANRWTKDVPMMIPEINTDHMAIIEVQKKRLGTKRGFIAAKPNCSIQSYVPVLDALKEYGLELVNVCTYQAISGSGKNFDQWPEMIDNLIPYIGGEEEKSEKEPLKIWATIENGEFVNAAEPVISAQCYRVPVVDGHMAAVSVKFKNKPTLEEVISKIKNYKPDARACGLPHSPDVFLTYYEEDNRPQSGVDRDLYGGMGVSVGRVRPDNIFDYKFACLSHNTLRGAAGGALLTGELIYNMGLCK